MTALVVRADAAHLPLPDNSVDLIVTSPPYFALRSYTDAGEHYSGQIGSEVTPQEFLEALWTCTREWVRVVKPTGSIFVNLGDKYAGGGGQWDKDERPDPGRRRAVSGKIGTGGNTYGLRPKTLIGLPWRYALGCIDQLGLILRAEIVWAKVNGLPESVQDRVRRSHETWFHFVLQPRYFAAVDEIREGYAPGTAARYASGYKRNSSTENGQQSTPSIPLGVDDLTPNSLGKLPGSIWSVPTEPLRIPEHLGINHFAAFPSEFPRRIILGWSPSGICVECNRGRIRHAEETPQRPVPDLREIDGGVHRLRDHGGSPGLRPSGEGDEALPYLAATGLPDLVGTGRDDEVRRPVREMPHAEALGGRGEGATERAEASAMCVRASIGSAGDVPAALHALAETRRPERRPQAASIYCQCPGDTATRRSVILDPFGGTGTTAGVASALGRIGVSVDLSHDYSRLARWRTIDDYTLRRKVWKRSPAYRPAALPNPQASLFDDDGDAA